MIPFVESVQVLTFIIYTICDNSVSLCTTITHACYHNILSVGAMHSCFLNAGAHNEHRWI
jgi:hypothetical protein